MARTGRNYPSRVIFEKGVVQPLGPYPTIPKVISLAQNPRAQKRLRGRVILPVRGVVQPLGPYPTIPKTIDVAVDPRASRSDRQRAPVTKIVRSKALGVPVAQPRLIQPWLVLQPEQPRNQKRQPGSVRWLRGVVQPLGPYPVAPKLVRTRTPGMMLRKPLVLRVNFAPVPVVVNPPRTTWIVSASAVSQTRVFKRVRVTAPAPEFPQASPYKTVTLRLAAAPRRRMGRVVTAEAPPVTAVQRGNILIRTARQLRRRLFGRVSTSDRQRMAPTGGATTLITTPATGYVAVDSHGDVGVGDTGQPNVGSTGIVGQSGASGDVNI